MQALAREAPRRVLVARRRGRGTVAPGHPFLLRCLLSPGPHGTLDAALAQLDLTFPEGLENLTSDGFVPRLHFPNKEYLCIRMTSRIY